MEPVRLEWAGEEYRIPPRQIMGAILAVEDVMTLGALAAAAQSDSAPVARIAKAYAVALRWAGAVVDDYDVYRAIFGRDRFSKMLAAVNGLLGLMVPPDAVQRASAPDAARGNVGSTPAPSGRKRRSRQRSAGGGLALASSGA